MDARLVFRDDTNLSLGPGSTLKLDRTVFDDPKPGDIAIKLTQGAFRFVTGNSEKEAYVIKTPIATMGVRGTTLDILVKKRRNKIVLRAGKVTVCVPGPGKCVDLNHEGDSANITANGKSVSVDVQNGSDWTFDRSEERRVGKECRYWWSLHDSTSNYHQCESGRAQSIV